MKATIVVKSGIDQVHSVAKDLGEKEVVLTDADVNSIKSLLKKAGTKIGSVHFHKRSDKSLRKMCYRLHVTNPTHASRPKGSSQSRKEINTRNNQITVFDVNKVCRDRSGNIKRDEDGKLMRGAWRTVPLENVTRICVDGVTYLIEK